MRAEPAYLLPICDRCGRGWHDNPSQLRHDGQGFIGPCCRTTETEATA